MRTATLAVALLSITGCAYIAEPLPPALRTPVRIVDLTAVQRGESIEIRFSIPDKTIEGMAMSRIGQVDLRVGPMPEAPFDVNRWAESARPVDAQGIPLDVVNASVPVAGYEGKEVVVGARTTSLGGRVSGWSNLITVSVVAPVAAPAGLAVKQNERGVILDWRRPARPGLNWRVYRQEASEEEPELLATVVEPALVDATTQAGKSYSYSVEAFVKQGESEASSGRSSAVSIVPKDTFAPKAPVNVKALTGTASIELAWERSTEADFATYRIYRAEAPGEFKAVADIAIPAYSDRTAKAGAPYRYVVTAIDRAGNESARSAIVEITLP